MSYQITYEKSLPHDDIQILANGIMEHARQHKGYPLIDFFAFCIRDENNKIRGGCYGNKFYGCLNVELLWVDGPLRGQDYGTLLMQAAEDLGKKDGCTFAVVNTMDWEALGFYQKLGYKIEFERYGFSGNSIFYFLRKEF